MEAPNTSETLVAMYQSTFKIPQYLTIISTTVRSSHIQNVDKLAYLSQRQHLHSTLTPLHYNLMQYITMLRQELITTYKGGQICTMNFKVRTSTAIKEMNVM